MAQLDGDEIVYVARIATQRIISIGLAVGSRLPAFCTSMGRVLIANLDEAARARYLAHVKLVQYTPRTIVDRTALQHEIERVRADGYAIVDQEFEVGLRSVAVPVQGSGGSVVASINVGVQASRATTKVLQREFVPVLRSAAAEIASTLSPGRAGVSRHW
jgi:IclR family pca regulon transcriptional regulator